MKYQFKVSFQKIVEVEAKTIEEAREKVIEEMLEDMGTQNETIENELEVEVVCKDCGINLKTSEEELEQGQCVQCKNN